MSVIYALKILALSPQQSSKEYFFKHNRQITGFSSNYKAIIGLNIFSATLCVNTYGEMVTLSIWDIGSDIPNELKKPFYKGAAGCLLFSSSSDSSLLDEFNPIISDVRKLSGSIPIFLILKSKREEQFSIESIEAYISQNGLKGYYIIPEALNEILNEISRAIIYNMYEVSSKDLSKWIKIKEREFDEFTSFFKKCPCCDDPLHKSYLRTFFFSQDTKKRTLKKRLLELMDTASKFNIKVGIPCCSCFEKYFK